MSAACAVAAVRDLVSGWRRAVLSEPFAEAAARPPRREAAGFPRPVGVLIRKNSCCRDPQGFSALPGHAIPLLCFKTALGTSSRHRRSRPDRVGRSSGTYRTPGTGFTEGADL